MYNLDTASFANQQHNLNYMFFVNQQLELVNNAMS